MSRSSASEVLADAVKLIDGEIAKMRDRQTKAPHQTLSTYDANALAAYTRALKDVAVVQEKEQERKLAAMSDEELQALASQVAKTVKSRGGP